MWHSYEKWISRFLIVYWDEALRFFIFIMHLIEKGRGYSPRPLWFWLLAVTS